MKFASIAQELDVTMYCIGAELKATEGQSAHWRSLVQKVRETYTIGKLIYSTNGVTSLTWWDAVDFISDDAYRSLSTPSADPESVTLDDLKSAWTPYLDSYKAVSEKFDRPILFAEIGICSLDHVGIYSKPWYYGCVGPSAETHVDQSVQAKYYEAFFQAVYTQSWLRGVFFWKWLSDPNDGGPQNANFTPHNKTAEAIMKKYFVANSTTPMHLPNSYIPTS